MQKNNKKSILYVDRSSRPSPFLVDIPKNQKAKEEMQDEKRSIGKDLKNRLNIFKRKDRFVQGETCNLVNVDYIRPKKERVSGGEIKERINQFYKTCDRKLSRLMFYPVTRFVLVLTFALARLFYRIAYLCGWFVTWFIRFTFLVFKKFVYFLPGLLLTAQRKTTSWVKEKKSRAVKNKESFEQEIENKETEDTTIKYDNEHNTKKYVKVETGKDKRIFNLHFNKLRPVAYFALLTIIFVSPLKAFSIYSDLNDVRGQVLGATESAVTGMGEAAEALLNQDFAGASSGFSVASKAFTNAQSSINSIKKLVSIVAPIIPTKDLQLANSAHALLKAGASSAELGDTISQLLPVLSSEPIDVKLAIEALVESSGRMKKSASELRSIILGIDNKLIPKEYRAQFISLKDKVILLDGSIDELHTLSTLAKAFLGWESDKRYLLVFQNNSEMRASGGFIGSYALVDFREGKITNLEIPGGGSYDTEAGLYDMVKAPEALSLVSPRWYFWDANWWPDWPTSANKLAWFFENSNGPTVDGVIGITPTVLEKLLTIFGPVDMRPLYPITIDSANVWSILQTRDEEKLGISPESASSTPEENKMPKKIIGDLAKKMLEEIPTKLNKSTFVETIKILEQSLKGKHILIHLYNEEQAAKISKFDWDGKIKKTSWDYLMIVNTNIAGGKSDRKINENINHRSEVNADGTIINTLTITRKHNGVKREQFTGVRNVNWLRIYVPEGSKLITASGFSAPDSKYFESPEKNWQDDEDVLSSEGNAEIHLPSGTKIYNEFDKTVFANWQQLDPGETQVITLKYQLPFNFVPLVEDDKNLIEEVNTVINGVSSPAIPYALMVQKQPGSIGSNFSSQLALPQKYKVNWQYPLDFSLSQGWVIEDVLSVDKYWAITAQEK